MSIPAQSNNDELSPNIEKLLDSANSASQTVAALHVAFLAFVAYLGVIVWGTTHEDLLRISPVNLPILDVELPLTAFYCVVPWMVVLLHFNLLMQLELLSCKLWNLDRDLPDSPAGQQVRDRLFIFPFAHLIVGRSSVRLIHLLLSLVVGITIIALPLFILLAAQIRFLPFHDEFITWSQRLAVWVDVLMLLALWPLIASPKDSAWEWWRGFSYCLLGKWFVWLRYWGAIAWNRLSRLIRRGLPTSPGQGMPARLPQLNGPEPKGMTMMLVSVPFVLLLSFVAVVPGSTTVETYYSPVGPPLYFEDRLIRSVPEVLLSVVVYHYDAAHQYVVGSCLSLAQAKKTESANLPVMLGPCWWFNLGFFPRNLNLREARLVPKSVTLAQLTRAIDPDKQVRNDAFKEFDGLNLQNRDLRFANMLGAVLPKADLRHVNLQGAILLKAKLQSVVGWEDAQLQSAKLGGTQLQNAGLIGADLQGADLSGAALQGADLGWAKLQSADLRGANLQGANLQGAKLQGTDLRYANLQGATLREAVLQGADLSYSKLQGADLILAELQGAELRKVELQGGDWSLANLEDIYIADSSMSGWNEQQADKLQATLKPILDADKFSAFQARMQRASNGLPQGSLSSDIGCYSNNRQLLDCEFHHPEQLDTYRTKVLHPKLIELACSDTAIASGIVRKGYDESAIDGPNFGLAAAIIKAISNSSTCVGLSSLSEQTRQDLQETAAQQQTAGRK